MEMETDEDGDGWGRKLAGRFGDGNAGLACRRHHHQYSGGMVLVLWCDVFLLSSMVMSRCPVSFVFDARVDVDVTDGWFCWAKRR